MRFQKTEKILMFIEELSRIQSLLEPEMKLYPHAIRTKIAKNPKEKSSRSNSSPATSATRNQGRLISYNIIIHTIYIYNIYMIYYMHIDIHYKYQSVCDKSWLISLIFSQPYKHLLRSLHRYSTLYSQILFNTSSCFHHNQTKAKGEGAYSDRAAEETRAHMYRKRGSICFGCWAIKPWLCL